MANTGAVVSQAVAAQREYLRPELEKLFLASSRLWSEIKTRTDVTAVSNRPARIPFLVQGGGKPRVGNFDGGVLGQGSSVTEVPGALSCVSLLSAWQYSALTEWSTNSDEKAIENYVVLTQKEATKTHAGFMDAAFQGDGSNTLDSIVSVNVIGSNCLGVHNANLFGDGWDLDVWSALGGTNRGTVTVNFVDSANNCIWLTGAVPAGTTAGDLLLINGSAGTAASGLFGLQYYQTSANTGTYMNIARSSYPGRFSTPSITTSGALTPARVRALAGQIKLAMGIEEYQKQDLMVHCGVDMEAAWENNALQVQRIDDFKGGSNSQDMLSKEAPKTIGGRPMLVNERAIPGRLDWLALKHWFKIETKKLDYYEAGGQTVFPLYDGTSGSLTSSELFYLVQMVQVGNGQPRLGAYMTNVTIPTGFFGR